MGRQSVRSDVFAMRPVLLSARPVPVLFSSARHFVRRVHACDPDTPHRHPDHQEMGSAAFEKLRFPAPVLSDHFADNLLSSSKYEELLAAF